METERRERLGVVALVALLVLAGCVSGPVGVTESGVETTRTPAAEGAATPTGPTPTPVPSTEPTVTVTVTEVVDGDTVDIRYENGTTDTVRLLGVDTPETRGDNTPDEFEGVPSTAAGRECLGRWGERASAFATDSLAGKEVRLGFDENEGRRGYYGRLLAYVYTDGAQFNYALIRRGYARMYDSSFVERTRYAPAEERAQAARRGLWDCRSPGSDSADADSETRPLSVSVHADAAGNDNENRNDEYVTVENTGEKSLNVTGWTVADSAGHEYEFTSVTVLDSGETLTLYTGSGEDTEGERYWGSSGAIWNNGGDTVVLRNASGAVVLEHTYE